MQRYAASLVLLFCIVLMSCSSKGLSRSKAETLIKSADFDQKAIEADTQSIRFEASHNIHLSADYSKTVGLIERAGWVTINIIRQGPLRDYAADVILTPKGVEQSRSWKKIQGGEYWWSIPTMQRDFVTVTGVTNPDPTTAVAEYQWRWIPTENGKLLGFTASQPEATSQIFQLFDDGWRIAK
jgi:hypothetical protein